MTISSDIDRWFRSYHGERTLRAWLSCISSPGIQAVFVYRWGRWLLERPLLVKLLLSPLYWIGYFLVRVVWGIEIPRQAVIGPGLYIGHFGGIVLSPKTIIGINCNISHGVTIGVSGKGEKIGVPVIGDNVYIAPGAKLFGKIYVGNNVKIGANAVIYKDVPDNAIAVLSPGFEIISFKGNTE